MQAAPAAPGEVPDAVFPPPPAAPAPAQAAAPAPAQAAEPAPGAAPQGPPESPLVVAVVPSQPEQESKAGPAFGTPEAASAVASNPTGNLLGQLLVGVGGEDLVDINAVLDSIEGLEGGPSKGGISWHTMEPATQCWRKAYWQLVRGLTPKRTSRALAFGSLFHACWELWYRFGGSRRYDEACDAVRHAGAPKLAGEVQRLVYAELQRFAAEEAQTWDVRAVEQNAIFWLGPYRISGKLVHIPITCRHDLILAKREPGMPCAPAGPVPQGVYVYDHKTVNALTYDTTKGYGMDPQFLTNALVYTRSDEPQMFGPLNGVIVGAAAKHKEPSDRSFFRIETTVDEAAVNEFCAAEVEPTVVELYRRLTDANWRDDKGKWPKNHSQCVGRYGCCRFFDLCDIGGESLMDGMYRVDESRILKVENFAEPPVEVKRAAREVATKGKPGAAAAEARKEKAGLRNRHKDLLLSAFVSALQTLDLFKSSAYLVPGHTERSVMTQLQATLRQAWVNEAGQYPEPYTFGPDAEGNSYQMIIGEKSIKWELVQPESAEGEEGKKAKKPQTLKGTIGYKAVAEALCKDWWDLKNLEAGQGR